MKTKEITAASHPVDVLKDLVEMSGLAFDPENEAKMRAITDAPAPAPPEKKKGHVSPTQRSLKRLRDAGWLAAIVEHFNPHVMIRQDLFGFGDILAVNEGLGVLIVQTTTKSGADRMRKMETPEILPAVLRCLRAGVKIEVHGWSKRGLRGERKLWSCRVVSARLGPTNDAIEWIEESA